MPDPLDTLAAKIAYGLTRGMLAGLAQYGPQLVASLTAAWRQANTSTAVTAAPATQEQIAAAMKAAADAEASGKMPPIVQS